MKNSKTIIGLAISIGLLLTVSFATTKTDLVVDQQLSKLLENNNIFKLRDELKNAKGKLAEDRWLYYQAHCSSSFNSCEESNTYIETLLQKFGSSLADSTKVDILEAKSSNLIRLYRYKEAANVYSTILNEYASAIDSSRRDDFANSLHLWSTIADVEPQLIHKQNDVELKSFYDMHNILRVPVKCGGIDEEFVFDTGANLSTIMHSYAQKMGMTIYEANVSVGTVNTSKVKTMLAAADSLYVGNILFQNVVFLVVPDESLSFPSAKLEIRGIVGFPVIYQMQEIHLRKDGTIFTPKNPTNRKFSNMYLASLNPIVQLVSEADTLVFNLDTGADGTELSKRFFDSHKEKVECNGKLVTRQRGGAGGVVAVEEYEIENFPFIVGSKSGILPIVTVNIEDYDFLKRYDGNLGHDILTQFNEMVLNFTYMYLDFN